MSKYKHKVIDNLRRCGISYDDAVQLQRISMTLHRWHELECGTDAGCVERDEATGVPYLTYDTGANGKRGRTKIGDREKGALKRLAAVMVKYPTLDTYIQGDPRGASLYIIRQGDIPDGRSVDSCYTRGVAVYK
jgi:hypothetical protein